MAVILNNILVCSVSDGRTITYVENTGRIARISDRVDLSDDAKPIEHGLEAVEFDRSGVDGNDGSDVRRSSSPLR